MNATVLAADHLPPASLAHARELRDDLRRLLAAERAAAADFLLALADFEARRGWEPLGHASLFAFLTRELRLSKGGAFFRLSAARLVTRFPEVLAALRDGRLCVTSVAELARVLTPENLPEVLPRFYGCSSREAKVVAAALAPRQDPPLRMVVTLLPGGPRLGGPGGEPAATTVRPGALAAPGHAGPCARATRIVEPRTSTEAPPAPTPAVQSTEPPAALPAPVAAARSTEPPAAPPAQARPVQSTEPPAPAHLDEVEPLDADLRRLHLTVSRGLLDKVARARDGLSHARPGATTAQVLEAALDLLLERQARAKALVRRPQTSASPPAGRAPADAAGAAGPGGRPRSDRAIPAAVEREVRRRDGDRCQFPLDGGSVCGSTWQVELDHLLPVALGGESTPANLRCACARHNRYAARLALGEAAAGERGARHGRRAGRRR